MGKILAAALAILSLSVLAGCSAKSTGGEYMFSAVIIEINGDTVTVEPLEGEDILRSADRITFSSESLDDIGASVGDTVTVIYIGEIMETYPASVRAVSWGMSVINS